MKKPLTKLFVFTQRFTAGKQSSEKLCTGFLLFCTMPLSSKTITIIATVGLMAIIPIAMFVIAAIIPSFYSGRNQLIKE